jgi:hypothetical protein
MKMNYKALMPVFSPAALCLWAITICIGVAIASADASRAIVAKQETKFGYATFAIPIQMKHWDEPLYNLLAARAKTEMAEFLKNAEQDAAARHAQDNDLVVHSYEQSTTYIEQFRSFTIVSYLEVTSTVQGDEQRAITFRTINFDKNQGRELVLGDILEGAEDRSKTLEALAEYARADLRDKTGEEEESEGLLDLTKADLGVYERFTLCPSTKIGKSAGLTVHFPPSTTGPYAGSDFHVTIPYTVFARFLKPAMKALFSGEPRQAPVSLEDAGT